MKNIITFLFPFSMLLTFISDTNPNTEYIKLEYLESDPSKPFPIIIFYLPGSIDAAIDTVIDRNFFIHEIEITEMEFEGIRKSIEESKLEPMPPLTSFISFMVVKNEEKKFFETKSNEFAKELFNKIIMQFGESTDKRKLVNEYLDEFTRRLPNH